MRSHPGRDLLAIAVVLGIAGGLVEGAAHLILQRLNVPDNVWYPILWIAPAVTASIASVVAGVTSAALSLLRNPPGLRPAAVFLVTLSATGPAVLWMSKAWLQRYAIVIAMLAVATVLTRWIVGRDAHAAPFFRRALRWMLGCLLLVFVGVEGGAYTAERIGTARLRATAPPTPNILLIIIDALRADHLSSYGYGRPSSPAIDRLAAEGVLFEQAFATSSYTLPSHASILTGLYPYQHGVEWLASRRWHAQVTLPEILQSHGYRTGAFSGNTYWFTREHGFGQGFLHFEDFFHSFADMLFRTAYGRALTQYGLGALGYDDIPARKRAPKTNAAVLGWVARDEERPFFVTINYMDVHDPYLPPQPYRQRFATHPNPGGLINWEWHIPKSLTPEELRSEIDAYDGSIAFVDDQINALVSAIRARQPNRELMVIITSDHGEEFGEHGGFLHGGHLYREAIHVPLIVWQPGRIAAGVRVSRPVSNASIPATVLDLLGLEVRPELVPSLQRLWHDAQADLEWPLPLSELTRRIWESPRELVQSGSLRSLVTPLLQYIHHRKLGPQLYNWLHDPLETNDLAKRPEMAATIDRLRAQLPAAAHAAEPPEPPVRR